MTASATISPETGRRASDDLGLWEPKRALTLEAARAHTRRIKILRYVLMVISAILLAILIWQFLSDRGGTTFTNDPTESVRMSEPRYSGLKRMTGIGATRAMPVSSMWKNELKGTSLLFAKVNLGP